VKDTDAGVYVTAIVLCLLALVLNLFVTNRHLSELVEATEAKCSTP
jgi:hypothetical protein